MITVLGEVGRVSESWTFGNSLTMHVPITVAVPASTPAAAVHLLIALTQSSRGTWFPVGPPVDNVVVPSPRSWGMLRGGAAPAGAPPVASNPYIRSSLGIGAQQEPSGIGVWATSYLGYVRDPISPGRAVTFTFPTPGGSTFPTWRSAVVYAIRGISAAASLWPTTAVVPVRSCTFFGSVYGDVNNPWSGGGGSQPETQTWLGEGLFFATCNSQEPPPSFIGFTAPSMVDHDHLAGLGITGGPAALAPQWDPGGSTWHQSSYHPSDITTVIDIQSLPPGATRGEGGVLDNYVGGPGLP